MFLISVLIIIGYTQRMSSRTRNFEWVIEKRNIRKNEIMIKPPIFLYQYHRKQFEIWIANSTRKKSFQKEIIDIVHR